MKFSENIIDIAELQPDYLGFIFYKKTPRYFENEIPKIDSSIQKVGVFVNATVEDIEKKVSQYKLNLVQLHGEESAEFCHLLQQKKIKVIKAFNLHKEFNFKDLEKYNENCDYFLFDTKGDNYGGNGIAFDWSVLENYHQEKPFFLSGGIGLENLTEVAEFLTSSAAKNCIAIDCNSKLELSPGLKSTQQTQQLINAFKE